MAKTTPHGKEGNIEGFVCQYLQGGMLLMNIILMHLFPASEQMEEGRKKKAGCEDGSQRMVERVAKQGQSKGRRRQ